MDAKGYVQRVEDSNGPSLGNRVVVVFIHRVDLIELEIRREFFAKF